MSENFKLDEIEQSEPIVTDEQIDPELQKAENITLHHLDPNSKEAKSLKEKLHVSWAKIFGEKKNN